MKKTEQGIASNIIIFALILIVIIGLMTIVVRNTGKSSKYDSLLTSLNNQGTKFYGAFWCPHCQEQEKTLSASRQKLETIGLYVECSTADSQGQTQICIDNKIESYPTWKFKDGIKIESDTDPLVCDISPGKDTEDELCKRVGSQFFKRWIFSTGEIIASINEPAREGKVWSFDSSAQLRGKVSPEKLAEYSGATLNGEIIPKK